MTRSIQRAAVLTLLVVMLAAPAASELIGAVDSQSIHTSDEEEAAEQPHQPRHGGYFGDADDLYHYELLLDQDHRLILYVNDDHNRPLNVRGLVGKWTLNPDDPHPVSGSFAPSPDGAYFVSDLLPITTDPIHVAVAVLKGRLWATMEFYLPARAEHREAGGPAPRR